MGQLSSIVLSRWFDASLHPNRLSAFSFMMLRRRRDDYSLPSYKITLPFHPSSILSLPAESSASQKPHKSHKNTYLVLWNNHYYMRKSWVTSGEQQTSSVVHSMMRLSTYSEDSHDSSGKACDADQLLKEPLNLSKAWDPQTKFTCVTHFTLIFIT